MTGLSLRHVQAFPYVFRPLYPTVMRLSNHYNDGVENREQTVLHLL